MSVNFPRVRGATSKVLTWLALVYSTAILLYLTAPDHYDPRFKAKYLEHLAQVVLHGSLGIAALLLGLLQFRPLTRWHRRIGYGYLVAVFFGGIAGLLMAWRAEGGPAARAGFTVMALLWLGTAAMGLQRAITRRFDSHRAWMKRNYALTFAAVNLRMELQGLQFLGLEFDVIYPVLAWLCWAPNLAIAELWIRQADSPVS